MSLTITNYESGEILLAIKGGEALKLERDAANRLIMTARMHTVQEFVEKLPSLVSQPNILKFILATFEGKNSSERWNLKEKFARLQTLTKDFMAQNPSHIVESVIF